MIMESNFNIIGKGDDTGCDVHVSIITTNTSNCNEQKQELVGLNVLTQNGMKDTGNSINENKNRFIVVQSEIQNIIAPHIVDGKVHIDFMPTEYIVHFADAFLGEKFNYKEIRNGKSDSKITKNNINDYKNKSVLINGLGHASALFVDRESNVYSFDTLGTHQNTRFNEGTGRCDYKGGGSMEIFDPKSNGGIANSVIVIEPDNRLQGDTAACAIWTICALLEVSKYSNIEEALDLESIDKKELTCKFKPHVLNNIIKLVSCIECGRYGEFDRFIKFNKEVDIDYPIPEESKLISSEIKKMVGEYDRQRKVKKIMPPIMSQSTIKNVSTDSMSTSTPRIYSEPNSTTPQISSTPPPLD